MGQFKKTIAVTQGQLTAQTDETTGTVGGYLPLENLPNSLLDNTWHRLYEDEDIYLSGEEVLTDYHFWSAYSPLSYLPQGVGVLVGRAAGLSIEGLVLAGRLTSWLCVTALLCLAMRLLPRGRSAALVVALLPMNLHETLSLGTDGMVTALATLMPAIVLRLRVRDGGRLSAPKLAGLYALAGCLALYKIVYLPVCLLYLLIPGRRFGGRTRRVIHVVAMAALAVGLNLAWLHIVAGSSARSGSDMALQLAYVLKEPLTYALAVARLFFDGTYDMLTALVGNSLGHFNVSTNSLFNFLYLALVAVLFVPALARRDTDVGGPSKGSGERWPFALLLAFIVASVYLLICTSEYLYWTPVYNQTIEGFNGRYLIPLLLPTYFAVHRLRPTGFDEPLSPAALYLILLVNAAMGLDMLFACL